MGQLVATKQLRRFFLPVPYMVNKAKNKTKKKPHKINANSCIYNLTSHQLTIINHQTCLKSGLMQLHSKYITEWQPGSDQGSIIMTMACFGLAILDYCQRHLNRKTGNCALILYKTNGQYAVFSAYKNLYTLTRIALNRYDVNFVGRSQQLFVLFLSKSRKPAKPWLITSKMQRQSLIHVSALTIAERIVYTLLCPIVRNVRTMTLPIFRHKINLIFNSAK